jgi:hypothetical protein
LTDVPGIEAGRTSADIDLSNVDQSNAAAHIQLAARGKH